MLEIVNDRATNRAFLQNIKTVSCVLHWFFILNFLNLTWHSRRGLWLRWREGEMSSFWLCGCWGATRRTDNTCNSDSLQSVVDLQLNIPIFCMKAIAVAFRKYRCPNCETLLETVCDLWDLSYSSVRLQLLCGEGRGYLIIPWPVTLYSRGLTTFTLYPH